MSNDLSTQPDEGLLGIGAIARACREYLRLWDAAVDSDELREPLAELRRVMAPSIDASLGRAVVLDQEQASWLKVLVDSAVPRGPGGPMDWEGAGRRYAEALLGFREPCRCTGLQLIRGARPEPGCAVHDPTE